MSKVTEINLNAVMDVLEDKLRTFKTPEEFIQADPAELVRAALVLTHPDVPHWPQLVVFRVLGAVIRALRGAEEDFTEVVTTQTVVTAPSTETLH